MRIAVIGGGVSGLGAEYVLLRCGHDVHHRAADAVEHAGPESG